MNRALFTRILVITSFIITPLASMAGVIVGGTRVIYDASKKEASLSIRNPDAKPYLIQSWVDNKGEDGEHAEVQKAPFIVTPPLFRLEAKSENVLRLIRMGGNIPDDRESVFWLNVKSIPSVKPVEGRNTLQVAVKTRIKLFFRPEHLPQKKSEDYKLVSFTYDKGKQAISVTNPTPYWITFYSLKVNGADIKTENHMAPPKSTTYYSSPNVLEGSRVEWSLINEYGGSSTTMISMTKP